MHVRVGTLSPEDFSSEPSPLPPGTTLVSGPLEQEAIKYFIIDQEVNQT